MKYDRIGIIDFWIWLAFLQAIVATVVVDGKRRYTYSQFHHPSADSSLVRPSGCISSPTNVTQCGEEKPSCSQCLKGGWTCPGYTNQWKFVEENSRLSEHYSTRKYAYEPVNMELEEVISVYEEMKLEGLVMVWRNPGSHRSDFRVSTVEVPRMLGENPLGVALVYCLEMTGKGPAVPLRQIASFFEYIPARLGHNAALDDAISCVSAIYCKAPSAPYSANKSLYQKYVAALSSLRTNLTDPALRMEPETLCASIILQLCEVCSNYRLLPISSRQ